FSSRRRHTIFSRDWSSDVCSSDLLAAFLQRRDDGINFRFEAQTLTQSSFTAKLRKIGDKVCRDDREIVRRKYRGRCGVREKKRGDQRERYSFSVNVCAGNFEDHVLAPGS